MTHAALSSLFNFYFFKQKTAYEMRISDWSSDVCSSDLDLLLVLEEVEELGLGLLRRLGHLGQVIGAGDRVHPDVAAGHRHVPLGARPDQVALAGPNGLGQVGTSSGPGKAPSHGEPPDGPPPGTGAR